MGKIILNGLKYSLYLVFHPFKAFWDLKHEKKGNVYSAGIIVFLVFLTFLFKRQLTGFIFNTNVIENLNIFTLFISIAAVFLIWCVSNWCITTLVDGEGSFKDIVICSAYALTPLVLIQLPLTFISNFLTLDEGMFYTFSVTISIIWAAFLMLVGIMTVHQFTMSKTILTVLIAVVGMIIIIFLFFLFFALIQQVINFFLLIKTEISMR